MIIILSVLLIQTLSLQQINTIPDEFILVKDEFIDLALDNYFVGDSIEYKIDSTSYMNLTNAFSKINQTAIPTNLNTTSPPDVSQFIVIPENISTLAYLVYASSET